jgi:hypothetical protein
MERPVACRGAVESGAVAVCEPTGVIAKARAMLALEGTAA